MATLSPGSHIQWLLRCVFIFFRRFSLLNTVPAALLPCPGYPRVFTFLPFNLRLRRQRCFDKFLDEGFDNGPGYAIRDKGKSNLEPRSKVGSGYQQAAADRTIDRFVPQPAHAMEAGKEPFQNAKATKRVPTIRRIQRIRSSKYFIAS